VEERLAPSLPLQLDILLSKLHQPLSAVNRIALPTMDGLQMIPVDTIFIVLPAAITPSYLKDGRSSRYPYPQEIEDMLETIPSCAYTIPAWST